MNIKNLLMSMGFTEANIGGGEFAMEKRFPGKHYVWITDAVGKTDFTEHGGQATLVAYDQDSVELGDYIEAMPAELEAAVRNISKRAFDSGCQQLDIPAVVEEAIHSAFAHMQKAMGVTDGGFASIFLSGPPEEQLQNLFRKYMSTELSFNDPAPGLNVYKPLSEWIEVYGQGDEQIAYERYCKVLIEVGKVLMEQPRGTYLRTDGGSYMISDVVGDHTLVYDLPHDLPAQPDELVEATTINGIGADEINSITQQIETALNAQAFALEPSPGYIDNLVKESAKA